MTVPEDDPDPIASHRCLPLNPVSPAGPFEGWLDHVSLALNMSYSREQLAAAMRTQAKNKPLNDICRTFAHELAHTGQALGTTLGYYTWMLRSVQSDYVTRMLRWLVQDVNLPLKSPLITYLPSLDEYDDKAAEMIHGWQMTEVLISEIAGTGGGYLHAAVQPPALKTEWSARWAGLQCAILELYQGPGSKWQEELSSALRAEPSTQHPDNFIALMTAMPAIGRGVFTTPAVMESAALAVELSPDDDGGFRDAIELSRRATRVEQHEYYSLLDRTSRAYPKLPVRSLLATHLAACDVVLNPPCLPIHLLDRRAIDFQELHPSARIVAVWMILGEKIAPARDIDDALRCADDICTALGWTTVSDAIKRAAWFYNDQGRDPRGQAFAKAVKGRAAYPPLLHNPWVPLFGSGALATMYQEELSPALWVFEDGWVPGGSPARADRMLFDALRTQWTRSMMLGRPVDLCSPVPLTDNAREHYARILAWFFSGAVGKRIRPPKIVDP